VEGRAVTHQEGSDEDLLVEHAEHPERFHKVPDLAKVEAAVARLEAKRKNPLAFRTLPLRPSPTAADAAIRKPLMGPSVSCPGFGYYHFHQNEPQ
jgi:hypothetical protein